MSQSVRLCMPLAKFSYANVPSGSVGPIPWTHISSQNDLFVLLEPVGASALDEGSGRRYRLKVLQDPNVHDDLDLSVLANEAQRALDEAQKSLVPGRQPSITVIVKTPCVAMRYPLADNQIRRFQVRYVKDEDFFETLRIFAVHKVPFIEASAAPDQATTDARQDRLATYSRPENPLTIRRSDPATIDGSDLRLQRGGYTLRSTCQPRLRDEQGHSYEEGVHHSTSLQQASNNLRPLYDTVKSAPCAGPLSATSAVDQSHHPISEDRRGFTTSAFTTQQPPNSTCIPRPSTAPLAGPDDLGIELPPKRQLPFGRKKKAEACFDAARTVETATTEPQSKVGLNKSGKGSLSPVRTENPQKSQMVKYRTRSMTKIEALSCDKSLNADNNIKAKPADRSQEHTEISNLERNPENVGISSSSAAQIDTQALLNKADSINASREAQQAKPLLRALPAVSPEPTDKNEVTAGYSKKGKETAPDDRNQAPATWTPPTTCLNHNSNDPTLTALFSDPNFARPATLTPPLPKCTSPAKQDPLDFWSLPEDERHAHLETWIVRNLDDANFVQLCKSLEGVWQRIFVKI